MKVYDFPDIRIEGQLFHAPGAGYDGGLTSGGAQFITPEPGGFGVLEVQPALMDGEWRDPAMSALMSRISGQIYRIRVRRTPQVAWSQERNNNLNHYLENRCGTGTDGVSRFVVPSLKGTTTVSIDIAEFGKLLRAGHVIGHAFECYLIDDVEYVGSTANITVTPPLRRDIAANDQCLFTPWFTGRISNGESVRAMYNHLGHLRPGKIIFQEAVLP